MKSAPSMACRGAWRIAGAETMSSELVKYDEMCRAIAACERIDEVKNIRDRAVALAAYARQAQDYDNERKAAKIRLRAERRAGELLKEMKESGGRHSGRGNNRPKLESDEVTPTLSDLGITKNQSSEWQQLAEIPQEKFEQVLGNSVKRVPTTLDVITRAGSFDPDFWKEHWTGMPAFEQQDAMPVKTVHVHFQNLEDVKAFADLIGQEISLKTKSTSLWYPTAEIEGVAHLRWVSSVEEERVELANPELEILDEGRSLERATAA